MKPPSSKSRSPGSRSPGRRLAWASALTLLALGGAELALRPFVAPWSLTTVFRFDEGRTPCYGLEPGSHATYEGWFTPVRPTHLAINSRGYRDREYPPVPAAGTLRIALLGDSHAFGLGTELEEGLSRRLEADLAARLHRPVEVVNAGVPGYDLPKEVARAAAVVDDYAPELLLFLVGDLDLEDRPCSYWKAGLWPLLSRSRLAVTVFVNLVVRRQQLQEMPDAARHALVMAEVAKLARLAAGHAGGGPMRVAFVQTSPFLPASPEHDAALLAAVAAAGVQVVPLLEPWQEVFTHQERYVVVGEGHPNAAGMALLAPALGAALVASGVVRSPGTSS